MGKDELIAFERRVYDAFAAKQCKGPVHLSGGNETQLIEIFKDIKREDWVFSFYRSHYHALLHGIDPEWLFAEILAGHSMNIMSPKHRFFTSAIVGGCLPIAVGVAAALKRKSMTYSTTAEMTEESVRHIGTHESIHIKRMPKVWCFVGDMAATTGAFYEATAYAGLNDLPITFIIEDNGISCDSPTDKCWGNVYFCGWHEDSVAETLTDKVKHYHYERVYQHVGIGRNVF